MTPTPAMVAKAEKIAKACLSGAHITWPDDMEIPECGPLGEVEWDSACPLCIALALTEARARAWEEAAREHRRHCPSFSCREGKAHCNEYETYKARAAEPRP